MTIRKSILISLFINILFPSALFLILSKDIFRIDFDVKRGISSLAINIKNSRKSRKLEIDTKRADPLKDLKILISANGEEVIDITDPQKKKEEKLKEKELPKEESSRDSKVSISVIGALNKKANQLSKNQPPEYPYIARKLGYQGKVTLQIQILPTGFTGDIFVIKSSGFNILDKSALRAARGWKFFDESKFKIEDPVLIILGLEFIIKKKI